LPNIRWLLAMITRAHRFLYLRSGGRLGGRALWLHFLLLNHQGRKTGITRFTPLLYVEEGGRWIVVASNAGDDRDPAWWLNLQARPEARIQVGRELVDVKARPASPTESEYLWPGLEAAYPYYPEYRERAAREIPIVILERSA
jgi:deazaflavin-dependent oxidoreductase (nitroreductase family)